MNRIINRKIEVEGQKSEDRSRKSEIRGQRIENRYQKKMLFSVFYLLFSIFCLYSSLFAVETKMDESDQQINDFSLAGYGEKGAKTWDISGKTADIYTDLIKLKDITGNLYGEKEKVKLTADKGDFNKSQDTVHLEKDVVVTTSSGATLTTDSLDWDRKNNIVNTKDMVNIEKDNLHSTSQGATGNPGLKKVELKKEVKLEITPDEAKDKKRSSNSEKIIVTCDGPLQIDYEKNTAVLNNNVKVDRQDLQIYSDIMDIYFNKNTDTRSKDTQENNPGLLNNKIDKIIARGNVKIVRGENISYSDEAVYNAMDKKITLSGKPKLVIYSTEGMNASFGN